MIPAGRLPAILALALAGGCAPPAADGDAAEAYTMALDMRQLMLLVLEPAAEFLWDSGGWVLDAAEGYQELYPVTDEGWESVRAGAAVVAESGNLLAMPGRAPDGDAWIVYAQGLSAAGLRAMEAAAARDKEAFFQAGADIYSVCSACHQAYSPEINDRFREAEAARP